MATTRELRSFFHDAPNSLGSRRRLRRWRWLADRFPHLDQMSVLDLGGLLTTWERAPIRAAHVHIVNLSKPPTDLPPWAEVEHGDACDLPADMLRRRYDLVFSNSVIEHVGGHDRRLRFAESVHKLADAHWVQTPYRYFPIEPHWLFPGLQFMPVSLRTWIGRRWPLGHTVGKSYASVLNTVLWTELLDRTQMRHYFPDSELVAERVWGWTKSLIAVRGHSHRIVAPRLPVD